MEDDDQRIANAKLMDGVFDSFESRGGQSSRLHVLVLSLLELGPNHDSDFKDSS